MGDDKGRLLQGTLDVLILKALQRGPLHGYALSTWIRETTEGVLQVEDGALYTALHRMEKRRWLSAEWGVSETNRRVKTYTLTAAGFEQLESRSDSWNEYADAVGKVLRSV
ncbi:MAG: PadR family transcriptional regulator [Gemmatimonadota bacterium]|nr:MAG: PadR family transcriptional regulator [Gemmatimonadota bacterium]